MPNLTRRSVLAGALAAVPLAAPRAQAWPSGPIRIVVPFAPGGSVDAIARLVQAGLQERLGQPIVVENRAGASGSTGAAVAAKAAPDGNTWLFVFDTHGVNPALLTLPFDTQKDLDPVVLIGTAPNVVAAHPSRPYATFADLVAAAKAKPDTVSYATVGAGSLAHLTMVRLAKEAGARFVHVPYRGGGPAINDAVAGHVDLICASSAITMPQIQGGRLKPLVQTGAVRSPSLPDVPTAAESGFKGFESNAWWGVFAPAGTPRPVQERFRADLTATLREERVSKQLGEAQGVSLTLGPPEELRRFLAEQMAIWGAVVRENGIKAES